MSKQELIIKEKRDAYTRILRFMTKADVTLDTAEEIILDRWVYTDVQLRRGVPHDEIIEDLKGRWSISKYTALTDINNTQRLFERCRQLRKKYLLHHHIERINQDIEKARQAFYTQPLDDDNDDIGITKSRSIDSKELYSLAKMHESYTKAIQALPEDDNSSDKPPPQFIFNIAPGQSLGPVMDPADAAAAADQILNMVQGDDGTFKIEK